MSHQTQPIELWTYLINVIVSTEHYLFVRQDLQKENVNRNILIW